MKIALLEDRLSRMAQFSNFDLSKEIVIEIITDINLVSLLESIEAGNLDRLNPYNCIILHRSALSNSQRDAVKNYCHTHQKPLVYFSGGISTSTFNDYFFPFLHINSKDLYSGSLRLFIDDLEKTKQINLLVLQFGSKWILNLLLSFRDRLNRLEQLKNQTVIRVTNIDINNFIKDILVNDYNLEWLLNSYETVTNEHLTQMRKIVDSIIIDSI